MSLAVPADPSLFARVFSAKSRAVSVTNDLVTMSVFTFLVVVLASVGLALVTTQKRWATGYMGTIAGLVSAAWVSSPRRS